MVTSGDGASDTLGAANRPVLLEGGCAFNGGSIGASAHVDIVGASITGHLALLGSAAGWVIGAEGFDDVVLNERAPGPAVEREVAVSIRVVCARVLDSPAFVMSMLGGFSGTDKASYLGPPGFHPFPPTKLPPVCH